MRGRDEKVIAVMLGAMRKFSKSWVAVGLIGLLIVAFAIWNVSDVFKTRNLSTAVVKAGSHEVKPDEFKRFFDNAREQAQQQYQRQISTEEAVEGGLHRQLLSQLSAELALSEAMDRAGIRPGQAIFEKALSQTPDFFDPITGKFDKKIYAETLARNGLTPVAYRQLVMDAAARQDAVNALMFGYGASRTHAAFQAVYAMQARSARFLMLDATKVARPAPPTDAQLKTFLNEVAAEATRPEFRQLTIVRFSAKAIAPTMKVTPEAVQQVFDFRKDQMAVPETRTIVQFPAKSQAMAAQIAQRLAKGEDPAAVAKSQGVDVLTYTDKPKTAIADRKVADVAFSLAAGQSSGPISGDLGFAAIKVVAIKPGKTVTLEDVRPQVEAEVRSRAAEQQISQLSDKFEAASGGGMNIADAARSVGLTPVVTVPVTSRGQGQDGRPIPGLSPKLLKTAFDLAQGGSSDLTEDERGEYYIVHVDKVIPPALPTVEEIRGPLTQAFVAREMQTRLKQLAEQLAERLRKGESIDAVAASVQAPVQSLPNLTQMSAQAEAAKLGVPLVSAVLAAKSGEVIVTPAQTGFVVGKVEAIRNGDVRVMAMMTGQAREAITRQLQQEFYSRIGEAAREAVKVKVSEENAKRALGIDPGAGKPEGKAG